MRILLTGASSFTGYWFARELAREGHHVTAVFQKQKSDYEGGRALRIAGLTALVDPIWDCSFGDRTFMDVLKSSAGFDILCHHAADVTDYRSPSFNVARAFEANTRNLALVLSLLKEQSNGCVLCTGSVFEGGEGAGSEGNEALSPYGLSKEFTWRAFEHYAKRFDVAVGKFVIPNPFGPYEEERFTSYLVNTWKTGQPVSVNTPDYVRDNIHVSLLAKAYSWAVRQVGGHIPFQINPSGYIESQGQFAQRVAVEVGQRTGWDCSMEFREQTEFPEPRIRINTDPVRFADWSEHAAWDEFVDYYRE